MPEEIDDTTAAEVGHALIRWLVNEDPAGFGRFRPDLAPDEIDDRKAAAIARSLIDLLARIEVV